MIDLIVFLAFLKSLLATGTEEVGYSARVTAATATPTARPVNRQKSVCVCVCVHGTVCPMRAYLLILIS